MSKDRKSILILVDWFFPGYKAGGPIQSCVNVALALKNHFDVKVLTTDTDFGETSPYPEIESDQWSTVFDKDVQVYYVSTTKLSRSVVRKILLERNPDFVHLNHMFSPLFVIYPLWLKWTGVIKSKFIISPRGALYESALSVKGYKKRPFLYVFKWMGIHKIVRFHATNERERGSIRRYFPSSEVVVADNLPNMRQPPLLDIVKHAGNLKCLFVARIHPIKNLLFLLKVLKEIRSTVSLTIVGPVEDSEYWEACQTFAKGLPANVTISYEGPVPNHKLVSIIQQHHLFFLPTVGENFGHSIFEAFLCGRPVLISDQTPWSKLEESGAGWDLPLSNPSAFAEKVEMMAQMGQDDFSVMASSAWQYASNFIQDPLLKQRYFELFS